jgi:hypothetical protein
VGQSAEEVRRDIERTREELGETFDAIGDKLSPRQAVRRRTQRMRTAVTSIRERVMGAADDTGSAVSHRAGSMTEGVRGAASSVATTVSEGATQAADAVREAPETIRRQTQGNPLAVGVVAFGLGALAGSLLPKTRAEQDVAPKLRESVVDPLKTVAAEAGQEMKSSLQESGRQAVEEVKATAQHGAERVKQEAQRQSEEVKGQAREGTEAVKEQVKESAEAVRDPATRDTGSYGQP